MQGRISNIIIRNIYVTAFLLHSRGRSRRNVASCTSYVVHVTKTRDNYIASSHVKLLRRKFKKKFTKIPVSFFTEKLLLGLLFEWVRQPR